MYYEQDSCLICDRCHKSYKSKGSLKQHQRLTCGTERQFGCSLCGSRFKHKHHLKKHLKCIHNLYNFEPIHDESQYSDMIFD